MEPVIECCCGLDVHQAKVVACLLKGAANRRPAKQIRSFGTMTRDLVELREWLRAEGCTQVAMESTGVYWMPVYEVLEGAFDIVIGNAYHMKNVPGRKTDVKDSEWMADLARHGLIRRSLVPPKPIRELRDLVRYRRKLVQTRSSERNRLLKLLETANIKLASVASNVFGVSGMLMLRALVAGATDAKELSALARGKLRKKAFDLALALEGRFEERHRFLLEAQLRRLDAVDRDVAIIEDRIREKVTPYAAQQRRLMTIPGIDALTAASIISEIGIDMSWFPSAKHLAAWAGVCPGNNESAGKNRRTVARKGNVHLRTMLVTAAKAAANKRGTFLREKYRRLRARTDQGRATMAIAHKILVAAYHVLRSDVDYQDLGESYCDRVAAKKVTKALVGRLHALGFRVTLEPINANTQGQSITAAEVLREAREAQTQLAVLEAKLAPP